VSERDLGILIPRAFRRPVIDDQLEPPDIRLVAEEPEQRDTYIHIFRPVRVLASANKLRSLAHAATTAGCQSARCCI
jgi:hypothetical protein